MKIDFFEWDDLIGPWQLAAEEENAGMLADWIESNWPLVQEARHTVAEIDKIVRPIVEAMGEGLVLMPDLHTWLDMEMTAVVEQGGDVYEKDAVLFIYRDRLVVMLEDFEMEVIIR